MIARENSPFAEGIASRVPTLRPPPDSPKIVTVLGSPPKRAMLSRTQVSAATMSSMPTLPVSAYAAPPIFSSARKPSTLRRWLMDTTTTSPRVARLTPS